MFQKRLQFFATVLGITGFILQFIATLIVLHHSPAIGNSQIYLIFLHLILSSSFLIIFIAWISGNFLLSTAALLLSMVNASLVIVNAGIPQYYTFNALYFIVWFVLYWFDKKTKDFLVERNLKIEKNEEEVNNLNDKLLKAKHEVELDFGKYSNYFRLREVADRFATSLSLNKVARLVVEDGLEIIQKGDTSLLYLTDVRERQLSLIASKTNLEVTAFLSKTGTIFDQYLLKSRQHLIITDTAKDFRFDYTSPEDALPIRSLIAAPLINEGRAIGTLRINSSIPDSFTTEDLRILNIIAVLASSAIWNTILFRQTEELAIRDSLTNLYVQRYFKQRLAEEHRRSLLTNSPLSLLMCDLDNFKQYNDKYGHAAGDLVLKSIARVFIDVLGSEGMISRYGGEEFAVILPNTDKSRALELAEMVRQKTEETQIDLRGTMTQTTVSIGVGTFPEDTLDCEDLILKTDRRLYDAKRQGRNRIC